MRPRSYAVIAATLALSIAVPLTPGALAQQGTGKPAAPSPSSTQPAPTQPSPTQPAPSQAAPSQNPAGTTVPKTMAASPLGKFPFAVQPFPLGDNGSYLEFMNRIAAESGYRCVKQEQYGWEFAHNDQLAVDKVFQDTMKAVSQAGYQATKLSAKAIADPEMAAFYAVKDKLRLLMVWVPLRDSLLLMMCQAEASKPVK